ncbi:MAG: tetratricopeptide repeat protein [Ekhidna sp.]
MKKIAILILGLAFSMLLRGQSQEMVEGDSVPWELRKQSFVYNSAKLFSDPVVARSALYQLIAENPANAALYDSLAILYLKYDNYVSATLVAQQSLMITPENEFAIEIAAAGYDNLGVKDKATVFYERLYLSNNDINTLYKISFLQFELGRYGESNTNLDIVISNPKSETEMIGFPTVDRRGQDVPLKVAAQRVKAMIIEQTESKENALKAYLDVLKMYPDFQIVQQQMTELRKTKDSE